MMKMTTIKMKNILQSKLNNPAYRTAYHRDKDELRVEWQATKQGVTIKIPPIVAKYNERGDSAIDEIVDHIDEALAMMNRTYSLDGMEKHILPVIRSTSFPIEKKDGSKLVMKEHTAETRIFYALDLGKSYRLIDETLLQESNWTKERLSENARFNLRSLPVTYKKDTVSDNDFYFVALQDGYDASRILNESFLEEMKAKCEGEMAVAVPHQDVLIIADIRNETGYDVLAQMTMQFFAEGRIPITSLSFIYDEKHLEPIFILAQNKRKK